jgi:hypothetical protein
MAPKLDVGGGGGGYPNNLPHQVGGKEVRMDHDTLKDVARKLRDDLNKLKDLRFKEDIDDYSPNLSDIGDYSAGKGLHNTVTSAQNSIGTTYQQFIQAYEQVIQAIERSEQNVRNADDASAAGARARGRVD